MKVSKTFFCFFLVSFSFKVGTSQIRSDARLQYESTTYAICTLRIDSNSINELRLVQNKSYLNHADFISEYISNHDSVFFATNACISDVHGEPIGLFVVNHQKINGLNLNDGSGNFYLKPNGALLITDSDIIIAESSQVKNYNSIVNAVQSGPMLVNNGNIHSAFDSKSQNRNIRSGVGIYTEKGNRFLVFGKSNEPVTFYDFAKFFKERLRCEEWTKRSY